MDSESTIYTKFRKVSTLCDKYLYNVLISISTVLSILDLFAASNNIRKIKFRHTRSSLPIECGKYVSLWEANFAKNFIKAKEKKFVTFKHKIIYLNTAFLRLSRLTQIDTKDDRR